MFHPRSALAWAISIVLATAAHAASPRLAPPDAVADRLVAEAIGRSPELVAAHARVEVAQRRIAPAAAPADPSVSLTYQNDGRALSFGDAEGSYLGVMLSQPLPWPGKRAAAGRLAATEAAEVEAGEVGRAEKTIAARVRNAWYDLLLARSLDRLIGDRRAAARQIEETVRNRYSAGLSVQQDVLRAQVEIARLDEAAAEQEAAIANATAQLNALLGRPAGTPVGEEAAVPELPPLPPAPSIVETVLASSPEVSAAEAGIESGRAAIDVAKKNFLPDFVVSGGSMYRGSFEMGPMWQVGVGISLPAWIDRRQQNQLGEAEARGEERSASRDIVRRELELRTHERLAGLEASSRIASLYAGRIVPLDELTLESALASYESAKVPFVSVLDALNALFTDRAVALSRVIEQAKWRVALDEASLNPTSIAGPAMAPAAMTPTASSTPPAGSSNTAAMPSMR